MSVIRDPIAINTSALGAKQFLRCSNDGTNKAMAPSELHRAIRHRAAEMQRRRGLAHRARCFASVAIAMRTIAPEEEVGGDQSRSAGVAVILSASQSLRDRVDRPRRIGSSLRRRSGDLRVERRARRGGGEMAPAGPLGVR